MIIQLSAIFFLLIVSMQAQLLTAAECRELLLLSTAFTVARGVWDGTTLLWRNYRSRRKFCPTEQNSLDVAIRAVGQQIDAGHIVSVTCDLPEGGSNGEYHLHVSFHMIRVDP
jgi:hypothetical protein